MVPIAGPVLPAASAPRITGRAADRVGTVTRPTRWMSNGINRIEGVGMAQVAIVTGTSSGMGLYTAVGLAVHGAQLVAP